MNFLNLTDNPLDDEYARLQSEIDELNYRIKNWDLNVSAVTFWADLVNRMQARLDALRDGDAKATG